MQMLPRSRETIFVGASEERERATWTSCRHLQQSGKFIEGARSIAKGARWEFKEFSIPLQIHIIKRAECKLCDFHKFQLFDGLKKTRGEKQVINQCYVISGDCSLPDLGISDADRKLLADNVSIVYHCAATVRFDETLKRALMLNTRGTKLMVNLSKTFKQLAVSEYFSYNQFASNILWKKNMSIASDLVISCSVMYQHRIAIWVNVISRKSHIHRRPTLIKLSNPSKALVRKLPIRWLNSKQTSAIRCWQNSTNKDCAYLSFAHI